MGVRAPRSPIGVFVSAVVLLAGCRGEKANGGTATAQASAPVTSVTPSSMADEVPSSPPLDPLGLAFSVEPLLEVVEKKSDRLVGAPALGEAGFPPGVEVTWVDAQACEVPNVGFEVQSNPGIVALLAPDQSGLVMVMPVTDRDDVLKKLSTITHAIDIHDFVWSTRSTERTVGPDKFGTIITVAHSPSTSRTLVTAIVHAETNCVIGVLVDDRAPITTKRRLLAPLVFARRRR